MYLVGAVFKGFCWFCFKVSSLVSFVGLSVGFLGYAQGASRFFVYLEAHCAF
jgi:hypothetical protein